MGNCTKGKTGQDFDNDKYYLMLKKRKILDEKLTELKELYDFKNDEYTTESMKIRESGFCIDSRGKMKFAKAMEDNTKVLFKFSKKLEKLVVSNSYSNARIWRVLHSELDNFYSLPLKEGDTCKIGSVLLMVKRLSLDENHVHFDNEQHFIEQNYLTTTPGKTDWTSDSKFKKCKICLSTRDSENNPFISPCLCIGSVKHVHLNCLKNWIKNKMNMTELSEFVLRVIYNIVACELCHEYYPEEIEHNGKKFALFNQRVPSEPHVVLELLEKEARRVRFICKLVNKNKLNVGRGMKSDIFLNDATVSRCHSILYYENNRLFLVDNESRFGTLVLLKNQLELYPNEKFILQIDSSVYFLMMKKKTKFWNISKKIKNQENEISIENIEKERDNDLSTTTHSN